MGSEEELLKSDFDQCFEHMRYYDSHFISIINLIFGGFAGVIVAAIAILASETNKSITLGGSAILFFFAWGAGTLLLASLLRNRVYFTSVARFVNEIRGNYLKAKPLGVENIAGLPTNAEFPKLFSLGSTHTVLMYFVALGNSIFLGASVYAAIAFESAKTGEEIQISIGKPILVFLISTVAELIWIILYLKKKETLPASEAWWGKRKKSCRSK